jgi:hypothetical protein
MEITITVPGELATALNNEAHYQSTIRGRKVSTDEVLRAIIINRLKVHRVSRNYTREMVERIDRERCLIREEEMEYSATKSDLAKRAAWLDGLHTPWCPREDHTVVPSLEALKQLPSQSQDLLVLPPGSEKWAIEIDRVLRNGGRIIVQDPQAKEEGVVSTND